MKCEVREIDGGADDGACVGACIAGTGPHEIPRWKSGCRGGSTRKTETAYTGDGRTREVGPADIHIEERRVGEVGAGEAGSREVGGSCAGDIQIREGRTREIDGGAYQESIIKDITRW